MKFAILGPGNIANKMARTVNALEGMELYAVASRDLDRAKAFAEKLLVKNIADLFGSSSIIFLQIVLFIHI